MRKLITLLAATLLTASAVSARGECKADREKLCKDVKKDDMQAMHQCMKSHEGEVSEPCRMHRAELRERSKEVRNACRADFKKLCKGVMPGKGRRVSCLKDKEGEVSAECKSALGDTNIEH